MKKRFRILASMLCAVLMVGVLTVPAYAGGGDESEGILVCLKNSVRKEEITKRLRELYV